MSVLRANSESLMCVLESFIHDPLLEWSKKGKGQPSTLLAASSMNIIEKKLGGVVQGVVPLSIEGQVSQLILDASSNENLSQMYIGWAAYY